jgi:ABC-type Fe3+/spermidine/putrescine transport system ATPase subunit
MFQSYALFPHMSVLDNLAYGLRVRKLRNDEVMAIARPALEEHGLWEVRDVKAGKLSGGQRQRVAFLRAMVLRPDVFLLDEPLSAMDGSMQESVRKGIRSMASSTGTPCILVTHNREDAVELGDVICCMDGGKIVSSHRAGEGACTCRRPDAFISSPEPGAGRQGSDGRPIGSIHELKIQSDESRAGKPSFLSDTLYPVRRP